MPHGEAAAAAAAAAAAGEAAAAACGDSGAPPPGVVVDRAAAKAYAASRLPSYGWGSDQFRCLDLLWTRESGWRADAYNASSGAYGIPQSLPGQQDGECRRGLAHERGHADQLGPGLHRRALRLPVRCVGPLGGDQLVLMAYNWY